MLPNMFMTRFGKRLTEFLSPLLPSGTHISEATLLRAYCAFQYNRIPEANRPPRSSFVLDLDTSNATFTQCDIAFSRFSIARFILSTIPCYCGDPLGIWRNQERHLASFTTNKTEPDRDMILANSGNRELCAFSFGFAIVTIKDIYKELCPNTIKTNESQIENESDKRMSRKLRTKAIIQTKISVIMLYSTIRHSMTDMWMKQCLMGFLS